MPIVKQYQPSGVSYGDVVYRSGQNQERYRRAAENLGTNAAANADAKYKLGMLALEKEKFAFEKPLEQKASDLKEIEAWLAKSIQYLQARAQAAQQRLAAQSQILGQGQMQIGTVPSSSSQVSGGVGTGGGSSQATGRSVRYQVQPGTGQLIAVPEAFSGADRSYQGNPYLSAFQPSLGSQTSAQAQMDAGAAWLAQANSRDRQRQELAKIDDAYRAELARIDEVFGVSQGWQPRLFLTGAALGWQAPQQTPAFGQDPLTGTAPRS